MVTPGEQVPAGEEQRRDQRADDKAVDAVNFHTANGGNQDQVVRHFGVFTHQQRAQNVIHQPDNNHEETDDKEPLPQLVGGEEKYRRRYPDNRRAHGGYQRQKCHQRPPQYAPVDADNGKRNAAQRPLNDRHHRRAFDRRPGDADKFGKQMLFHKIGQRQRVQNLIHQIRAIF